VLCNKYDYESDVIINNPEHLCRCFLVQFYDWIKTTSVINIMRVADVCYMYWQLMGYCFFVIYLTFLCSHSASCKTWLKGMLVDTFRCHANTSASVWSL